MNDDVLIIGAGFAGLCLAIRLQQAGFDRFTLLERAEEIGGTWRDNRYPGCACDVESHLYCYSFEPNAQWSRAFAEQAEILDYLRHCAQKYALLSRVRLGENVESARFDEAFSLWIVRTTSGNTYRARTLVSAMGALSNPSYPDIAGLARFEGERFHSAAWNHDYDLSGKRVAVIGSGASAIQLVPEIAGKVARLDVYQRTAPWILPKADRTIGRAERAIYRALPLAQKLRRWGTYWQLETRVIAFTKHRWLMRAAAWRARRNLQRVVRDPELRAKLTPDYTLGCKRVLISNDYYAALVRPNVSLITEGIREVLARSIVDRAGREREVDAIVFATGFKVQNFVPRGMLFGRGGLDIADAWRHGVEAYKGTTVAGFPNVFFLLGPNTGVGHSSMIYMIESQVTYVMDALRRMREEGWSALEVKPGAQAAFNQRLSAQSANAVWQSGCKSWYVAENGHNTAIWPDFTFRFRQLTRRFDAAAYQIERDDDARRGATLQSASAPHMEPW
jgi:cation diffusion facilitator CzcD-associated flavoprotein CzcO